MSFHPSQLSKRPLFETDSCLHIYRSNPSSRRIPVYISIDPSPLRDGIMSFYPSPTTRPLFKTDVCCIKRTKKPLKSAKIPYIFVHLLQKIFLHFRLKDVPSPFLGITAIYCFVYFINNYILCFLTHFNVLVLNSF